MVSIKGLSKPAVLSALYNASKPLGMGFMQFNPKPMDEAEAGELLSRGTCFDYLKGRVMKLDLSSDSEFDPWLYDRDNGPGAAAHVVQQLRTTNDPNSPNIKSMHGEGVAEAAISARKMMGTKTTTRIEDGASVVTIDLDDVKERLAPAIARAMKGKA